MAQAFADKEGVGAAWKHFSEAMFPFQKEHRVETDKKMVAMMQKEAGKVLSFKPVETNILKNRAKTLSMPDAYAKELRMKLAKGRRLK